MIPATGTVQSRAWYVSCMRDESGKHNFVPLINSRGTEYVAVCAYCGVLR